MALISYRTFSDVNDPVIQYCLLGSFAVMFALSASEKFSDRSAFRAQLSHYRLLPEALVGPAAIMVPLLEITTATLLLTAAYRYGVYGGLALLSGYTAAIGLNLLRGRTHIDCGCLGSQKEGISSFHVLRNLIMVLMLASCLLSPTARSLMWLDYFVIAAFLAAAMLIFSTLSHLLASHMDQRNWWS